MIRLFILLAIFFTADQVRAERNAENFGLFYGVSHIATEATVKLIKENREPKYIEQVFSSILVGSVMLQVVRNSSRNDTELFFNSSAATMGVVTGNIFQMEW